MDVEKPAAGGYGTEIMVIAITTVQAILVSLSAAGLLPLPFDWFRRSTGIEVGTGGMTRAAMHLLHGEWGRSLVMNPYLIPLLLCLAMANLSCVASFFSGRRARLNDCGIAILIILATATLYRNVACNLLDLAQG